jgi:hypothetical protein
LASEGLFLYTMDGNRTLRAIDISDSGFMVSRGSLSMPAGGGKLFVGGGIAYVAAGDGGIGGFASADVSNPDAPVLLSGVDAPNVQGEAIAVNGSGLAVTVGNVRGPIGQPQTALDVMNVSDPSNTGVFLTRFNLPARPSAVAIAAGIAFVADGTAGLQVVNYKEFDTKGIPPTITLSTSFPLTNPTNGIAEEGKPVSLSAKTTDDVQVRDVQFYVDGVKASTDVSFPFEHRFIAPLLTATKTNFTVRAKATDTGGNFTWSDEIMVILSPDVSPPFVTRTVPSDGAIVTNLNVIYIRFSEPINPATISQASFDLTFAGPDQLLGTADDLPITLTSYDYLPESNAVLLRAPATVPQGLYGVRVRPVVSDLKGNVLAAEKLWKFALFSSGPNGDDDNDGVSNAAEFAAGSNPFSADTDGDGWDDLTEAQEGSDPRDPKSGPHIVYVARPPISIDILEETFDQRPTYVARPPLQIDFSPEPEIEGYPLYLAEPPVAIDFAPGNVLEEPPIYIARPPVSVDFVPAASAEEAPIYIARPPLEFDWTKPATLDLILGFTSEADPGQQISPLLPEPKANNLNR